MTPFAFKLAFLILFALVALYLKASVKLEGKPLGVLTSLIIVVPTGSFLLLFDDSYDIPFVAVITAQLCYLVWLILKDRDHASPDDSTSEPHSRD